eukprot:13009478-Alexandrium_andersonii.AAC.1
MQLERPSLAMQAAVNEQDDFLPDINEIEPEGAIDVGSVGYPPSRPPGLVRAGGQPQVAAPRPIHSAGSQSGRAPQPQAAQDL